MKPFERHVPEVFLSTFITVKVQEQPFLIRKMFPFAAKFNNFSIKQNIVCLFQILRNTWENNDSHDNFGQTIILAPCKTPLKNARR